MDLECFQLIQSTVDQKIKPLGSLGKLESLALQLGQLQTRRSSQCAQQLEPCLPHLLIFCADHGVVAQGVSVAPQQVTQIMLESFLKGHAACNCFCETHDVPLTVVNSGLYDLADISHVNFVSQSQGRGTKNLYVESAMTVGQVSEGLILGGQRVQQLISTGVNCICLGEMGIGNTTSASALLAALTGWPVDQCIGRGSGINQQQMKQKMAVVSEAISRCTHLSLEATVAEFGGYEIVQLVGAILKAAHCHVPVIIDGFIVTVAAYIATLMDPSCRDAMVFSHVSNENAHSSLLDLLNAEALLDLDLRLGEGTGAVLAVPLVRSSIAFYNGMASLSDVGIAL